MIQSPHKQIQNQLGKFTEKKKMDLYTWKEGELYDMQNMIQWSY